MLTDPQAAPLRPLAASGLSGEVKIDPPSVLHVTAGCRIPLVVEVTNHSTMVWPAFSDYAFMDCALAYLWRPLDRPQPAALAGFLAPPTSLAPGASARVRAEINAPAHPGSYELVCQLAQRRAGYAVPGAASAPLRFVAE
jgi:hypothetical protein